MTLRGFGGVAALTCAGTYIFGFVLLFTVFAPLGFGGDAVDPALVAAFIVDSPAVMIIWNTAIYIVNGVALAVLVVALHGRLRAAAPDWATVTLAFGLIWATLVLGAGMIANVATERVLVLAAEDLALAAQTWQILHAVELGLGGGNEIAGGVWILSVSIAGWQSRVFGRFIAGLGALSGLGGVLTLFPPIGQITGVVFGLGAIVWFIAIGLHLLLVASARSQNGQSQQPA